MQIDSAELKKDDHRKIPENVHTLVDFNLPFAIPVPDGLYEVTLDGSARANKILNEGFMNVDSTDAEERILAIEKMVDYLNRITPTRRET